MVFSPAVGCAVAQSGGTFTMTGSMTIPCAEHSATLLPSGKVLIAGGYSPSRFSQPVAPAELYDPSTGAFTPTGAMTAARAGHSAILLADGRVLIVGGLPELYDPSRGSFTRAGAAIPISVLSGAVLLADGRVLVEGCASPCNSVVAGFYDPAAGTFTDAATQFAGGGPEVMLADGKVLIVGGCPANNAGTKAQVFDPVSGVFSPAGLMTNGCADTNTGTVLLNGKVLFVGSDVYPVSADASLYDPVTGTFANVGPAIATGEYAAATLILTGGQQAGGNGQAVSEFHMPASGTFSSAGNMVTGRHFHTSTLLGDGTVL
ncbi:MAG TPA: kelch repeat-containing protein, partial [Bryobacteraceae bacterium]|nr:kelch repeat-containing protein [Bryobacteraceae bacterium]